MENLTTVYVFKMLDYSSKILNKIKASKTRYDCVSFAGDDNKGLHPFKNKKGMLFLSLQENSDYNRTKPQYNLTGQGLNFTGLLPTAHKDVYVGYPNNKEKLTNGKLNPVYLHSQDLYIIHFNKDKTMFKVLLFKGCKVQAKTVVQNFLRGSYLSQMEGLNSNSKEYFPYMTSTVKDEV